MPFFCQHPLWGVRLQVALAHHLCPVTLMRRLARDLGPLQGKGQTNLWAERALEGPRDPQLRLAVAGPSVVCVHSRPMSASQKGGGGSECSGHPSALTPPPLCAPGLPALCRPLMDRRIVLMLGTVPSEEGEQGKLSWV